MKHEDPGRFERAVVSSLDAIVATDEDGMITLWNPAAAAIFGYGAEEAVESRVEILVPEYLRERHRTGLKNFVATGKATLIGKITELEALRKDGTALPIELSLSAEKVNGRWAFTGIIRDITWRKRLEEELRQRLSETERLNRIMIGRELKMEELRKEITDLKARLGERSSR